VKVGGVSILMISCEGLYLDRTRQATVSWPREDVSFDAALELALTNYITTDWDYIRGRIRTALSSGGRSTPSWRASTGGPVASPREIPRGHRPAPADEVAQHPA
jgi:hypothetical protein